MASDEPRIVAAELPVWQPRVRPLDQVRPASPIPTTVGDLAAAPARTPSPIARLGRLALTVTPIETDLLNLVAEHPFLPSDRLAVAIHWEPRRVREQIASLRRRGLVRPLDPREAGDVQADALWELTVDGLRLVAARMGLPLPAAVRANGLVGGGPEEPIGRRRNLVRYLAHTLGADNVFVDLYRLADRFASQGGDDEELAWLGPAACTLRLMRPDGYGTYYRDGTAYESYLEYDRGTTSRRDYYEKFTSYYRYVEHRRFERDYHGFPMVLVVTTSPAAEKRIAEALRTTSRGYPFVLPVLLTCEGLGVVSEYNPEGLLGPIWRDAWSTERRYWLPPLHVASTRTPT
jgi:Replication-relaxation